VLFWLLTRVGRRNHKFNRIRQVAPMSPHGRAHWRHLTNTTEASVCCGDAALCQITLTTCCKSDAFLVFGMSEARRSNFMHRLTTMATTHRASTTMYWLTFRVTTPLQYGRNGTAQAAGASILSPARGVFAGMRNVRHACSGPGGLPLGTVTHFHSVAIATQTVHRLQIRPIVHN